MKAKISTKKNQKKG